MEFEGRLETGDGDWGYLGWKERKFAVICGKSSNVILKMREGVV